MPQAYEAEMPIPPKPADPTAAPAYAALNTHCAGCHQAGELEKSAPGGGFANVLDLEAVARDPAVVRRGMPEASPLYRMMLSLHPKGGRSDRQKELGRPTSDEVLAVRDWIAKLSPVAAACGPPSLPTARAVAEVINRALAALPGPARDDVRFISLAHLSGSCLTDAEVSAYRGALGRLLDALAPKAAHVSLETVNPDGTIVAVSLAELGWSAERWAKLTRDAPRWPYLAQGGRARAADAPLVVPGDWLAFAADALPSKYGYEEPAAEGPATVFAGLEPLEALRRLYTRSVDLRRAAAEHGMGEATFAAALAGVPEPLDVQARRLQLGTISRNEAEQLYAAMRGEAGTADSVNVTPRLSLWTERGTYAPGEEISITVHANRPCYLTLINVDTAGKATVLFPNDFERQTLLEAGQRVRVPDLAAPYLLRTKDRGRETFVAICSAPRAIPPGIDYDFERQRFAVLGNWHNFTASAVAETIKDPDGESRPRRVRRRGGMTTGAVSTPPALSAIELRAAIAVEVR
jgi:hypothetical protein